MAAVAVREIYRTNLCSKTLSNCNCLRSNSSSGRTPWQEILNTTGSGFSRIQHTTASSKKPGVFGYAHSARSCQQNGEEILVNPRSRRSKHWFSFWLFQSSLFTSRISFTTMKFNVWFEKDSKLGFAQCIQQTFKQLHSFAMVVWPFSYTTIPLVQTSINLTFITRKYLGR